MINCNCKELRLEWLKAFSPLKPKKAMGDLIAPAFCSDGAAVVCSSVADCSAIQSNDAKNHPYARNSQVTAKGDVVTVYIPNAPIYSKSMMEREFIEVIKKDFVGAINLSLGDKHKVLIYVDDFHMQSRINDLICSAVFCLLTHKGAVKEVGKINAQFLYKDVRSEAKDYSIFSSAKNKINNQIMTDFFYMVEQVSKQEVFE